ncbi:chemotaxis response regulator CheY [Pleionea sp. CnH1-48]|uniref:chemotaxis response regulator CheY n=1 Tax=Pleionea sp. CnH1-48 TaxID=2954494 RepID=UPI0020980877|nr:chemotaxis response regulator CheY [Pleionea sp. CnH1-48]MCO7226937.1 chemotaxis response regulator CheY [Pleionea sp. CnH1-48]
MKILLVDDFSTMRRIIKNLLREIGFDDVVEAEDGKQAIAMMQNHDVDMVITDWNMPVMSGIDLLRHIRTTRDFNELPVLMVTAESKREQIVEAAQAGVNGYIVKPFNGQTLQEKIGKILQRNAQPA